MHELSFGFSPCPNDTFAFNAVVHGLVGGDLRVRPSLRDIEDLNRAARTGELELSKISVGALAGLGDGYRTLRAGAALGHGVGPLVVARDAYVDVAHRFATLFAAGFGSGLGSGGVSAAGGLAAGGFAAVAGLGAAGLGSCAGGGFILVET